MRRRLVLVTGILLTLGVQAHVWHDPEGVVLFEQTNFRGESEIFHESDPDLSDNPISHHRIRSLQIPDGWEVIFYERTRYRGRSVELHHNEPDLRDHFPRNFRPASLHIHKEESGEERYQEDRRTRRRDRDDYDSHGRSRPREGVSLFQHGGFRGRSEVFYESDPDLRDNTIGNDQASSIRVPDGWKVTLYQHSNFRGRSVTLTGDQQALSRTAVGNDAVSSIRVEPEERGFRFPSSDEPRRRRVREGVTLFEHVGFRGRSEVFYESDPDLRDNTIGNDRASSIRVPQGWVVTLYQHANFRGRSIVLRADHHMLSATEIGNDQVSSIKVERERRRR